MENKTKNLINEIRFKLTAYEGEYEFIPEDEIIAVLEESNNWYSVCNAYIDDDNDVIICILTEWADSIEIGAEMLTEESLKNIYDAIRPLMTLLVSDSNGKQIYVHEYTRRIAFSDDALSCLIEVFNLNWEENSKNPDVWKWVYRNDAGEEVLHARFM